MDVDAVLLRRATPLLFGIFGHTVDGNDRPVVRVGGSGIFVAPFLALTARHVNRDLFRLDPRFERPPKGTFRTLHSSGLFQLREAADGAELQALWAVDSAWDSNITDLTLMQVSLEKGYDKQLEFQMPTRFFEWRLLPPEVGDRVDLLGFPETGVKPEAEALRFDINYVVQQGHVTVVHPVGRDRGMLNFPCFEVDRPVDHGFSGGPAFLNGKLCGIVSAGSFENHTVVASLWPLCLMEYEYPGIPGKTMFGELIATGVLPAADWSEARRRISKRYDANGQPYAQIE